MICTLVCNMICMLVCNTYYIGSTNFTAISYWCGLCSWHDLPGQSSGSTGNPHLSSTGSCEWSQSRHTRVGCRNSETDESCRQLPLVPPLNRHHSQSQDRHIFSSRSFPPYLSGGQSVSPYPIRHVYRSAWCRPPYSSHHQHPQLILSQSSLHSSICHLHG